MDFTYDVLPQPTTLIIPRPDASVEPDQCAFHGILYNWEVVGFNPLPDFAMVVENGLKIETNKASDAGTYTIVLEVLPNGPNTVDPVLIEYELVITACRVNTITVEVP